jgi:phosphatidylinositol alpha-mannosyltransferase
MSAAHSAATPRGRMKIAMLSFRLPMAGAQRGGVERVAHDLANGLARRGYEVTVWSADPAPGDAVYRVEPMPGRSFIHSWLGFRLVSGYIGNVLALLPDYAGADVIIAHGDSLLLPLQGVPVLRIMHGSALDECRTARSIFRKILQFGVYLQELITSRTQETIGISRNTRARYSATREVVPNGVDTERFFPEASERSLGPSILFVGRLGGRKRGGLLLEWFANQIRPAIPNAQLLMVCEPGPEKDGVEYFSGISDERLAALYRRAWVVASPSTYEGFGLPYLEAMASGVPVVSSANAGSLEVLDSGRYGRIVWHDSNFAPALVELLQDDMLRERWIQMGLGRARDFSLDRMVDSYERVLQSLAARSQAHEARI